MVAWMKVSGSLISRVSFSAQAAVASMETIMSRPNGSQAFFNILRFNLIPLLLSQYQILVRCFSFQTGMSSSLLLYRTSLCSGGFFLVVVLSAYSKWRREMSANLDAPQTDGRQAPSLRARPQALPHKCNFSSTDRFLSTSSALGQLRAEAEGRVV